MITRDQPWDERLAGWIDGCDAWVVQREVVDLPTYVELWLKDAGLHGGPEYHQRYDTWLSWFDEQGAEAVGFGWINLRRVLDRRPDAALRGLAVRRRAAHRSGGHRPLRPHRSAPRAGRRPARRRSAGRPSGPPPGDVRRPGSRGPVGDRAPPAATRPPSPPGRHRRGGPRRCLRRRAHRSTRSSRRWASCSTRTPADLRASYLPVVRDLITEGFLDLILSRWWTSRTEHRSPATSTSSGATGCRAGPRTRGRPSRSTRTTSTRSSCGRARPATTRRRSSTC